MNRVIKMLKSLQEDEDRLKKCINNIEVFHRDMFVLPYKEDKPVETENASSMKDDINESEYSLTEPECSGNEPIYSMNEPDSSMNRPDCSMTEQKQFCQRLILKIPKSCIMNMNSSKNEVDDTYGSSFSKYESGNGKNKMDDCKNEPSNVMNESGAGKDEFSYDIDESGTGKDEFSYDIDESGTGKDEFSYDIDESGTGKDEFSYDMEESAYFHNHTNDGKMAKMALLDLLANKEKEITKLVLNLIYTFHSFQSRLQTAETSVFLSGNFFPSGSNENIKRTMTALSASVLHLDKTVSNIFSKYSEMLEFLGKIFE
ncbi:unnamed protein product [Larinioides sclopetarius]|uniref:Uncharacterized protein n=1 Tax=Larinioides sclopetarius TaxID=280406 RepID=A0AAV1ZL95_9ARAC